MAARAAPGCPSDPALTLADGVTRADAGVLITFQNMCIRFPTATTPEMLKFGDTGVALWTWARADDPTQAFVPPSTAAAACRCRPAGETPPPRQRPERGLGAQHEGRPGDVGAADPAVLVPLPGQAHGHQGCNLARTSLTGSTATDWPALQDARTWQYLSIWGWVSFGVDANGVGQPPPPDFVYNVLSRSAGDIPTGNVTIERSPVLNNKWVMIGRAVGLGDKVVLRTAPAPYGPWSSGFPSSSFPTARSRPWPAATGPRSIPSSTWPVRPAASASWVELHGQ